MADFRPFSPCWGDLSFRQPLRGHRESPRRCLAAVPVGGGGAWPGSEMTHQAEAAGVEGTGGTGGPGCGARGRQGLAGQRGDTPNHTPAHRAPLVWRAPEGPEGQAAVPMGDGRAWPGFETTRRAKLEARTARGRAAAHRHTKQPGPQDSTRGTRNTSGATSSPCHRHTQRPDPAPGRCVCTQNRPTPQGPGGSDNQ